MICKEEGCCNEVANKRKDGYQPKQCKPCQTNLTRYGITTPQRDVMLKGQDSKCLICEITLTHFGAGRSGANVDHCHTTGEVRGILCSPCNKGLGHYFDRPDVMRKAAKYLEDKRNGNN